MIFKKNICLLQVRNGPMNSANNLDATRLLLIAKT